MKRSVFLLTCLIGSLFMILSSCAYNNDDNDTTKNIGSVNIDKAGAETRVLFPFNNWYNFKPIESGDDEIIERLQKNLKDNGINVKFIPYYDYSSVPARKTYTETIKEMSASGSIDAFHIPKYLKLSDAEINMFEELGTPNQIDIMQKTAPVLYKKLEKLEVLKSTDSKPFIPVNVTGRTETGRNTVVIREDVAKKLGIDSIRTFSEYESVLRRIKSETQYIPGYMQVMKYSDIMLQELGYYSIEGVIGDFGGRLFAFRNDDKELVKPIPIEQIPGINDQFTRLFDLHQQGLLKLAASGAYPDFSNVASFIEPAGSVVPTFNYEQSRAFPLYPDQPVKKEMFIYSDKFYILKGSKAQNEIIRMLEWINSKPENMRLVRYGKESEDYEVARNGVKILLNGKTPDSYDAATQTYNYRFRFQFLLSSVDEEEPTTQKTYLPLEKLMLENLDKDIGVIAKKVTDEYMANGTDITKLTGITSIRVNNYFKALEFYLTQGTNVFGNFVKSQNTDEVKAIQEFYAEVIRRMKD